MFLCLYHQASCAAPSPYETFTVSVDTSPLMALMPPLKILIVKLVNPKLHMSWHPPTALELGELFSTPPIQSPSNPSQLNSSNVLPQSTGACLQPDKKLQSTRSRDMRTNSKACPIPQPFQNFSILVPNRKTALSLMQFIPVGNAFKSPTQFAGLPRTPRTLWLFSKSNYIYITTVWHSKHENSSRPSQRKLCQVEGPSNTVFNQPSFVNIT